MQYGAQKATKTDTMAQCQCVSMGGGTLGSSQTTPQTVLVTQKKIHLGAENHVMSKTFALKNFISEMQCGNFDHSLYNICSTCHVKQSACSITSKILTRVSNVLKKKKYIQRVQVNY